MYSVLLPKWITEVDGGVVDYHPRKGIMIIFVVAHELILFLLLIPISK